MPEYEYRAREISGAEVTGTLTADSEQQALSSLAGKSLFPTRIVMADASQTRQKAIGKRVSAAKLATFYSQMGDLLHSGVPLLRSLELLERQATQPALSAVLQDVRAQVADGTRLAEAMRRHPRAFSELAVSMVRAGEEGGFLEDVLKRVALFTEHEEDLKGRVVGALVYPLFLLGVGFIVVIAMLVFFVPKFAPIFERQKELGELPLATTVLMGMSDFLQHYGLWVALGIVGLIWWGWTWLQSESGRMLYDTWRLKMVGLGPIIKNLATSRFCRILGTMLKNGVPLLNALRIAKDATGNKVLSAAISHAADNITAGKSLARPLASSGQFSQEVVEMISVGEEANNLEQVLLDISDNLERRTHRQLDLFVRMLEPVMLMVMAVMILFVVVALLMPVFQGASAMS